MVSCTLNSEIQCWDILFNVQRRYQHHIILDRRVLANSVRETAVYSTYMYALHIPEVRDSTYLIRDPPHY